MYGYYGFPAAAPAPDPVPAVEPEQVTNPLYSTAVYSTGSDFPTSAIHPGTEEQHRANRIRTARDRARRAYPGPVGELVWRELDFQLESKLRHDCSGGTMRLVDAVMAAPLPPDDATPRVQIIPVTPVAA